MDRARVKTFSLLAGQEVPDTFDPRSKELRELGAQLLLSETLEYIIEGLGVHPEVNGVAITEANDLKYIAQDQEANQLEMLDGLADVGYTMFWNACCFGLNLEEAFDLVCNNNLSKFVHLSNWEGQVGQVSQADWGLGLNVEWPEEVVTVDIVSVDGELYGVGKDVTGKVRKPSTYQSVDLEALLKD